MTHPPPKRADTQAPHAHSAGKPSLPRRLAPESRIRPAGFVTARLLFETLSALLPGMNSCDSSAREAAPGLGWITGRRGWGCLVHLYRRFPGSTAERNGAFGRDGFRLSADGIPRMRPLSVRDVYLMSRETAHDAAPCRDSPALWDPGRRTGQPMVV